MASFFYVLTVVLVALSLVSAQERPHGVDPMVEHHYQKSDGMFACLDGKKMVPWEQLNDDFCDCLDGSDEPGTSACSTGRFFCRNEGSVGKSIFSSRVRDGICDCCDGSDEIDLKTSVSKCPNTCAADAERLLSSLIAELRLVEGGLAIKNADREALNLKERKMADKARVQAEIEEVEGEIVGMEQARNEAQDAYDAKKAEKTATLKAQLGISGDDEEQEAVPAASEEDDEWEEDREEGEVDKVAEEASTPPPEQGMTPREMLKKALEDDEELAELQKAISDRNSKLSTLRDRKSTLNNELNDINAIVNIDFGPNGAFAPLYDKEISKEIGEYTWKVTPFKNAYQSYTSLGHFDSWKTPYTTMSFTGGQNCWNGPDRSLLVTFSCGDRNDIIEVREPSKCTYTMQVMTPYACTEEHRALLRSRLPAHMQGKELPPQEEKKGFFGSLFS